MSVNPYIPTDDKVILRELAAACSRNASRDASDHKNGFGAPGDNSISDLLRTAICAFLCGVKVNDRNALLEGLEMLIRAEVLVRQLEGKLSIKINHREAGK